MLALYATALSANARKPMAVAHHLALELDLHRVNVYRGEGMAPEFRAISPLAKVPALVDGELRLFESNAIIQYLAEGPGGGRLTSDDPALRADIARWMFWEASHWQPELTPVLAPIVAHGLGVAPAPSAPASWDAAALAPHLALLADHLQGRDWLVADALSLADFAVAGMTTYFRYARFPFDAYPALAAWHARVEALPAWRATATEPWSTSGDPH